MKEILKQIYLQKPLSYAQAKQVLLDMGDGKHSFVQVAAFLSSYSMRYITIEEFSAFRDAMLELCHRVDLSKYKPMDVCGTGGDGKNTFNVSTLTALLVASCGLKVAKHGNYGVSSICGSSNVLEALGVKFTNDNKKLEQYIEKSGICFLHAPLFHPAMKHFAPVRIELKVPTFFNMLGPLVNPSPLYAQLSGVFSLEILRIYQYLLEKQNNYRYAITHSLDGYDEISLTDEFKLIQSGSQAILAADYFGMQSVEAADLYGGETIDEAVDIFIKIAKGCGNESQNNVLIANAAMAMQCYDANANILDCVQTAKQNLLAGKAYQVLNQFLDIQTRLH